MVTQDQITTGMAVGVMANAATGWMDLIPDQTLQNVMYEVIILWTVIQIIFKISSWYKGNKNENS